MNHATERSVLVTGAFGNIGRHVLREFVARGHVVRAFDLASPAARRDARAFAGRVEVHWGDMRDEGALARAVAGQDAVVHLAGVLPNQSERASDEARDINVGGMARIVAAMERLAPRAPLVFASSYSVYGDTRRVPGLVTAATPPAPINHYTRHKLEAEDLVRASSLTWCIMRLGATMSPESMLRGRIDPLIFDLPADARQEFVHCDDVAHAIAECLARGTAWGRLLLIGGGPACRFRYADMINRALGAMGIGSLPEEAFSRQARQGGGWMDTDESQALLGYQRHDFETTLREVARRAGWRRYAARALAPALRWYLVRQSPYYLRGGAA